VGTDALSIPRSEPTMNFGWLTPESDDDEFSRVVTHEFGHALGAVHEHQNPAAEIPWDKPKVYDYYAGAPNFWTKEQVEINLFQRYDAQQSQLRSVTFRSDGTGCFRIQTSPSSAKSIPWSRRNLAPLW
jgi:hypothetical protein